MSTVNSRECHSEWSKKAPVIGLMLKLKVTDDYDEFDNMLISEALGWWLLRSG